MKIEWDQATWYSKIIASILFILLPFAGFYLGTVYQKGISPTQVGNEQSNILENLTTATSSAINTPITKDCGKVTTHGGSNPALDSSANQVEDCFWENYNTNKPASLIMQFMGVDSGSNMYFNTTANGGPSKISGYSQSYMVPRGNGERENFTCDKLTKDSNGLHAIKCNFKNSTEDILIPAFH